MNETELESVIDEYLKLLRIETYCDIDVLAFLHRHQTSLVGPEHIARLVGHETGKVVDTLESLESLGLVTRSRVSGGVRLYQFVVPSLVGPEPGRKFDRFMEMAVSRRGRLYLIKKLRPVQSRDRKNDTSIMSVRGSKRWPKAS